MAKMPIPLYPALSFPIRGPFCIVVCLPSRAGSFSMTMWAGQAGINV